MYCFIIKDKTKSQHQHDFVYLGNCPRNNCTYNYIAGNARRRLGRIIDHNIRDKYFHLFGPLALGRKGPVKLQLSVSQLVSSSVISFSQKWLIGPSWNFPWSQRVKSWQPNFPEKLLWWKSPKIVPKMVFLAFAKYLIYWCVFFTLKIAVFFMILWKLHVWGKFDSSVMV